MFKLLLGVLDAERGDIEREQTRAITAGCEGRQRLVWGHDHDSRTGRLNHPTRCEVVF